MIYKACPIVLGIIPINGKRSRSGSRSSTSLDSGYGLCGLPEGFDKPYEPTQISWFMVILMPVTLDWVGSGLGSDSQPGITLTRMLLSLSRRVVPAIQQLFKPLQKRRRGCFVNLPGLSTFCSQCQIQQSPLITNSLVEKDGLFEIDFDQLENLVEVGCETLYLCNPHNPGGRGKIVGKDRPLCQKHSVLLVSDEIHQRFGSLVANTSLSIPLILPLKILPFLSSATKTFNIAGTKNSYAVIENLKLQWLSEKRWQ